jgi:two-component system chemotaxis sensor kinase CheA
MTSSEEAFLKKLRAAFVSEAQEQVERISTGLASLRNTNDEKSKQAIIENTFREVHNIKGSARAVNLLNLEAVCQSLEDVFAALKRGERDITPELLDIMHDVVDAVSATLTKIEPAEDFDANNLALVLEKLRKLKSSDWSNTSETPVKSELSDWSNTHDASALYDTSNTANTAHRPNPKLASFSDLSDFVFAAEPFEITRPAPTPLPDSSREVVRISSARLDELLMRAEDMLSLKIMSRQHNQDLNDVGFKYDTYSRDWSKVYAEVRSARQLIDHDQASAEHLFIDSVLTKVMEFLDRQQAQMSALSNQLINLKTSSLNDYRLASGTVDNFLENTKKLLMMPASTMLELMPKLVRDLARELGKEVDLSINGGDIQLDKRVLAQLKDPLIHILRNSIDHGLESPETRIQSCKAKRGSLHINVLQQEGNLVEIVITDDGAGINIERIKEIAIRNRLISGEQAAKLTDEEAISMIFQSSFSTSSTISEISGRGLGLAIAKENIENLGGRLLVESRQGLGTTFRITLPVTIANFRGVLVKCSNEILIVPTSDMERVMKVKDDQITVAETGKTISVDGNLIPLVRLDEVLELPIVTSHSTHHLLMVLRNGETSYAFEINEVLEEQEVLVKKLSKPIVRIRNVAGVTILGSGKPAAILNVRDLIKSAAKLSRSKRHVNIPVIAVQQKRILVVDDTITARILMKNILESAGYLVKTANDGTEALKLMREGNFDLLVTDIEMPKMNGIELTAAVKNDDQTKQVPIILVTSMTDQHYRDKGNEAGADAFFVKSSFDQNNLLDVVKRLI